MKSAAKGMLDLSEMEGFAEGDSLIHRLDARGKIILVVLFSVAVASFDRYQISALLPFFSFPLFILVAAGIPASFIARKLLVVSVFAFAIGIANPFIDHMVVMNVAGISVSGGWVSFASIMTRFALTASSALLLLATTGLRDITKGLEDLGMPQVLANQLFFLCGSLFLLSDEVARMSRGREARSIGGKGADFSTSAHLLTTLLSRSIERSGRVHTAMLSRGFDGTLPVSRGTRWRMADTAHLALWVSAFAWFRFAGF
ncbi:MAG: cobalt ECF transporter T component CbiQ [Kiritimatiellaeota bacterium]|nr:cobalt ECF transporter T component CbiQ [Kiritimatiellota bacterium]